MFIYSSGFMEHLLSGDWSHFSLLTERCEWDQTNKMRKFHSKVFIKVYYIVGMWEEDRSQRFEQSCLTLCDPTDCNLPGCSVHENSPGKNTGVGCHSILQGISPTQGSNLSLPHCRQILTVWATRKALECEKDYLFVIMSF